MLTFSLNFKKSFDVYKGIAPKAHLTCIKSCQFTEWFLCSYDDEHAEMSAVK